VASSSRPARSGHLHDPIRGAVRIGEEALAGRGRLEQPPQRTLGERDVDQDPAVGKLAIGGLEQPERRDLVAGIGLALALGEEGVGPQLGRLVDGGR
jgi:hypothetical protein